jgi:hypothetical protein
MSPGKLEDFVTALRSAAPELRKSRRLQGDQQLRGFDGIKVKGQ